MDKEEPTMSEDDYVPNSRCENEGHSRHLCILTDQYFHLNDPEKYREMVREPEFKCKFCGRTAKSDRNLCYPVEL
jgi:hypothetical protein